MGSLESLEEYEMRMETFATQGKDKNTTDKTGCHGYASDYNANITSCKKPVSPGYSSLADYKPRSLVFLV
jgi:hypothetical protein